jgi:DHA1 family tetracycline resistance protein-like MFS transporter
MGLIGAAFGLGFIFGPAIGGVLSRQGYSVPMFVGAGLAAFNFVFALFTLGEPPLTAEARAANRSRRFDREALRTAFGDARSKLAITEFFLFTLAWTQIEVVFALYLNARYGYDARDAGMLLAAMGFVMVMIQGGLIGRLVKKYGEIGLVLTGLLLVACGLTAFGLAREIGWAIAMLGPAAIGQGILHPSLSSLASKGAKSHARGVTMGVFQSAGSLARVIGPVIAGFLYDQLGWSTPFYAASGILALGFVLMAAQRKSVAVVQGATA